MSKHWLSTALLSWHTFSGQPTQPPPHIKQPPKPVQRITHQPIMISFYVIQAKRSGHSGLHVHVSGSASHPFMDDHWLSQHGATQLAWLAGGHWMSLVDGQQVAYQTSLIAKPSMACLAGQHCHMHMGEAIPLKASSSRTQTIRWVHATLNVSAQAKPVDRAHWLMSISVQNHLLKPHSPSLARQDHEITSSIVARSGQLTWLGSSYLNEQTRNQQSQGWTSHIPILRKLNQDQEQRETAAYLFYFVSVQPVKLSSSA